MRALLRFLEDQFVPAALTVGLFGAQRFGLFTLLPLNIVIEREYGGYAILLGAIGAVVAATAFTRRGSEFGLAAFALTAVAGLLAIAPFVLGRAGITLGLSPQQFTIVAIFAYLALAGIVGVLIGGCWSLVVNTIRESRAWE
jgi:hypothetical protein